MWRCDALIKATEHFSCEHRTVGKSLTTWRYRDYHSHRNADGLQLLSGFYRLIVINIVFETLS